MSIAEICSRTTWLIDSTESAQSAAKRMKTENVGTLVVVDGEGKPVGILTDRDLTTRVLAEGRDAGSILVSDVMTAHPRCVREAAPVEEAVSKMRSLAVRRLPVTDDEGHLTGIVSVDDVMEFVTRELHDLGQVMGWSQPGRTGLSSPTSAPMPAAST